MFGKLFKKENEFNEIPQEDCESLESSSTASEKSRLSQKSTVSLQQLILLLCGTFAISGALGAWTGSNYSRNFDGNVIARISKFSPLLPDVDISFRTVQFNGSLLKENIFRQNAGPEVDSAWETLGVDYRATIVPVELAETSGLRPGQVQVSDKYGGGFPANVEGLHHLHCLVETLNAIARDSADNMGQNLLRKSLYYNFDYYHALGKGAFLNDDRILRFHVSHCLDILRQQLMCTVDVGVLGQVWWNKETPFAYPDFNTKHTCRNFEDVRRWAEKHQAPENVPEDYLRPPRSEADVSEFIP